MHSAEAARALTESIRIKFDDAKIWENYLLVHLRLGRFAEILQGLSRLYILTEQLNWKILDSVAHRILLDEQDHAESPQRESFEFTQLGQLFNLIEPKYSGDPAYWMLYADYASCRGPLTKVIEHKLKAYRCLLAKPYEIDVGVFESLVLVIESLVPDLIEQKEPNAHAQANSILLSCLRRTEVGGQIESSHVRPNVIYMYMFVVP